MKLFTVRRDHTTGHRVRRACPAPSNFRRVDGLAEVKVATADSTSTMYFQLSSHAASELGLLRPAAGTMPSHPANSRIAGWAHDRRLPARSGLLPHP